MSAGIACGESERLMGARLGELVRGLVLVDSPKLLYAGWGQGEHAHAEGRRRYQGGLIVVIDYSRID